MTFLHLTDDPNFQLDPERTVIGWGVKNHGPCERMRGVLYVAPALDRWLGTLGWGDRRYVAVIELDGVEGEDFHTLSDTETLIVNLAAATVVEVKEAA